MQSQRVKSTTNNVFHFFEYRQLEQLESSQFDSIINFGDDKMAIKVNHNNYSTIRIETTSTYLYIPVSFESVYGKVDEYCYLSPGHIITVESVNNDPLTNRLVVYRDIETNGKSEVIEVGNRINSIACHDMRIAVSVENVGILIYSVEDDIKLIAKIHCKAGVIKIHRDFIINYVDHIVTVMDLKIVSRREFFDNLGDAIIPNTQFRWNAVDLDVEVYGEKHITHAITLMQERVVELETMVFIPQRVEEREEGVRVVLGSKFKLEVYYISYTNCDVKITMISCVDFGKGKEEKRGKFVATPCHVLCVHDIMGMTVVDVYPLRKYFSNTYEVEMGVINEYRQGDATSDLPCMSRIFLPGITDLVVVNHKVIVVRSIAKDDGDSASNEVYIFEPLVVRLCQEIKGDMERTVSDLKRNNDTRAIQAAISYKTYYELSVILEAYLSDIRHFIRRRNNNWTDLYWRDVMNDEALVVKGTLQQLYSIIAEELLDSKNGQLAAYYFSKANTEFSRVVDKFIVCEVKSCINLYFDEVFFNANKEKGAALMVTQRGKVFKLLENEPEKFIEVAIQPVFLQYASELNTKNELLKQRENIKQILSTKRKGTKEQEDMYFLEACCIFAQYVLMLQEEPEKAKEIDLYKELNTRSSKMLEFEVFNKFKSTMFKTSGNHVEKQPIMSFIENTRPLLFVALLQNDVSLTEKYVNATPESDLIELAAYEKLFKEKGMYGRELLDVYCKLVKSKLEYPTHKEIDKNYKLSFERIHEQTCVEVPNWIPEELTKNLYIKKLISLLTQTELKCDFETERKELIFVKKYGYRKEKCGEFVKFLDANYKGCVVGFVKEFFENQKALEQIAVEALGFDKSVRDQIFDIVSSHISIKCFCCIAAKAPEIDLSIFLRKCIGSSFYNKHLIDLCDSFPKQ
ncbi:hypothetical protein EIN_405970 [Entamoeba invadens IP1]|uniref:Uncharacterized protein n=1 Tax=Entamoeba invadens IP1 TaxID=370355 RepID=A0A0A1U6V1_ENTIV|nr:hypothetical protein EIN_405970 [Entamoeba invadens IP1]ELP90143.1 hypothetical protein EIN_405970 [Entamoeba invadens IP1]|eukprot:XP_004256914.1 hypothetical protein EIN_405970 [Entamoeba invadens IP1]